MEKRVGTEQSVFLIPMYRLLHYLPCFHGILSQLYQSMIFGSEYLVLESKPLITKEKYRSVSKLIKDRRNRTKFGFCWTICVKPNLECSQKFSVEKWIPRSHFWSFRVERGLYICVRHLPREPRVSLFRPLGSFWTDFRPRSPYEDPRNECSREVFDCNIFD